MQAEIVLAGCIIVDDYGRLLLLHRYTGNGQWELPGGKVEEEESPEAAAVRELQEETGITVSLRKALGNDTFEEAGNTYRYHWFMAQIVGGEPQIMETDTFDDLDYFDIEDLASLALSANMLVLQHKILTGEVVIQD